MRGVYYQVSNALFFLHLNSQSTLLAAHLHDLRTSSKLNFRTLNFWTKASGNCSVLASWRVYNGFIMSQGFRCCKIAPSQNSSRLLHVNLVNWNCKWGKVLPVTEIKPDRRGKWSVLKTILKICGSWSSFMLPPDLSSWVLDMISCWSQGYWKKGMLVFIVMFCFVISCGGYPVTLRM